VALSEFGYAFWTHFPPQDSLQIPRSWHFIFARGDLERVELVEFGNGWIQFEEVHHSPMQEGFCADVYVNLSTTSRVVGMISKKMRRHTFEVTLRAVEGPSEVLLGP